MRLIRTPNTTKQTTLSNEFSGAKVAFHPNCQTFYITHNINYVTQIILPTVSREESAGFIGRMAPLKLSINNQAPHTTYKIRFPQTVGEAADAFQLSEILLYNNESRINNKDILRTTVSPGAESLLERR